MFMLKGKVAIVTGASRGIGKAIAIKLAQNGANVAIIYSSNSEAAKEVVDFIQEKMNVKAVAYQCDVSDFKQTKEVFETIIKEFGQVDILVNNAGITKDKLILTMKEEDFDKCVEVNLKGVFNMIKHSSNYFVKRKEGRIINISSVSALMGTAGQSNYVSSKAGVIGLTKSIARELGSRNITCNAIAPGFIETDMTSVLSESKKEEYLNSIPLKRLGAPEDVANAVLFLASDMASYITGEIIRVDGGIAI